jgi:HD superfamily phosphodiesterase
VTHQSRIVEDDYAHLIIACLLHDIGYVLWRRTGIWTFGSCVRVGGRQLPR